MGKLKDFLKDVGNWFKDLFNGKTFVNKALGYSDDAIEGVKEYTEPGSVLQTVADATPFKWDDTLLDVTNEAATKVLPYAEVAADLQECVDNNEKDYDKFQCMLDKVRQAKDSHRWKFYVKLGGSLLRQIVFNKTGEWMDKGRAERLYEQEAEKRREIERILKREAEKNG